MRRKHQDLLAWQHAIQWVKAFYRLASEFPDSERFGLGAQMRRAAISLPSNIARGSPSEIDTQLVIATELGYTTDATEPERSINDVFACSMA